MYIVEPTVVYPESEFHASVVHLVREILEQAGRKFLLVESFGLDIAVFVESPVGPYVRMLEVKAFGAQRMGGVGFGGPKGTGSQVNLLLCPDGTSILPSRSLAGSMPTRPSLMELHATPFSAVAGRRSPRWAVPLEASKTTCGSLLYGIVLWIGTRFASKFESLWSYDLDDSGG